MDLGAQLDVVRRHAHRVLARREFHDCVASELDLAYLGGGPIALGPVLGLWNEGALRLPCGCGDRAWVHHVAGSPLSGTLVWNGWCASCRNAVNGRSVADGFETLWAPLRERILRWASDPRRALAAPPLWAVVAMLEGREAVESLEVYGERLELDWATTSLRRAGRTVLRLDGGHLRDPSGFERFGVTRTALLATDGAPLVVSEPQEPGSRRALEHTLRKMAGGRDARAMVLRTADGSVRFLRTRDGVRTLRGQLVVRCGPALPDAIAGLLALQLHHP